MGTPRMRSRSFCFLEHEGRQMLVYKHALSTISPARPVSLSAILQQERNREE